MQPPIIGFCHESVSSGQSASVTTSQNSSSNTPVFENEGSGGGDSEEHSTSDQSQKDAEQTKLLSGTDKVSWESKRLLDDGLSWR